MKTFALAVLAAAGLMLTAGSADAQFRYRNSGYVTNYNSGSIYSYPSYSYPSSSYPSTYYATPYSTGVVTSGYTPYYGSSVVVPASGYTTPYYAPTYTYPSYSYGTYSSNGMYRGRRR